MKILTFFTGLALIFLTATCNQKEAANQLQVTGTIQEQGMTSYQYGTHTLTNSETFYAIKSDSVELDQYLNQRVTVTAEKVEGYPVDGGPEYLRILSIEE